MKRWNFIVLRINESDLDNNLSCCSAFWVLQEGFKLWLLGGWWNTSKFNNGGQEVTSRVMNQRKTVVIMWEIKKFEIKRREITSMKELKAFPTQTTLHLLTLLQLYLRQVRSATPCIW